MHNADVMSMQVLCLTMKSNFETIACCHGKQTFNRTCIIKIFDNLINRTCIIKTFDNLKAVQF